MKEELESYIQWAYDQEHEDKFKDVYVTNHEPVNKKYFTTNK